MMAGNVGFLLKILVIVVVVLLLYKKEQDSPLKFSIDYISKLLGKPKTGDSIKWSRNFFFLKGLFVTGLIYLVFPYLFPDFITAFALNVLVASIAIKKSKKYKEYKSEKIKSYVLGSFLVLLFSIIRILVYLYLDSREELSFLNSKTGETILVHLLVILVVFIIGQISTRKLRLLQNTAATAYAEGKITRAVETRYWFAKIITYEYEFIVNGRVYNGVSNENEKERKKRAAALSETQKIIYVFDNPTISKLAVVKDKNLFAFYALWFLLICLSVINCIVSTDLLQMM